MNNKICNNLNTGGDEFKIAQVIDKATEKMLFEVKYCLNFKGVGEKKAENMYASISNDDLLNEKTFEVVLENIQDIVGILVNEKGKDNLKYDAVGSLHTHKHRNAEYIICYSTLLKTEQETMDIFKAWLLLTAGLIYMQTFIEANTFIESNPNWHDDLSKKFTVNI